MEETNGGCHWCGGGWRRSALGLALLALPALFWSAVFAALAGARPLEQVLELLKSF